MPLASVPYAGSATGPTSAFQVRFAGAVLPATWTVEGCTIREVLDQRATADLTLLARSGPAQVAPGTRLDVLERGLTLFSGTVERTADTILPSSARAVRLEVAAVDASQIADRRLITDRVDFAADDAHPSGWHPGEIAASLVSSYLAGEGVTAFGIDRVSSVQPVTAAFEYQSVASALTALTESVGWGWRIDANRTVLVGPRGLTQAPFAVVQDYAVEVRSTPGLVGYWRLGEATGQQTAVDLGPGGTHGTYAGSPTLGVAGLLVADPDTAVGFNATSAYVAVNTPWTFSASGYALGVSFVQSFAEAQRNLVSNRGGAGRQFFGTLSGTMFWFDETLNPQDFLVGSGLADGRPHRVWFVRETASRRAIYIDGALAATQTHSAAPTDTGSALWFGRDPDTNNFWPAVIDEITIINTPPGAAYIRNDYQAGLDVWTHRPLLENVSIERTRERLRTVQIVRGFTSTVELDTCDVLGNWNVSTLADAGGPRITTYQPSATSVLQISRGTWASRFLDLSVPTRLELDFFIVAIALGNPDLGYAAFQVLADADGAGPALWFQPRSIAGIRNTEWGLTTANCWASVNTPATTQSLAAFPGWLHVTLTVTSGLAQATLALSHGALTIQQTAAVMPAGGFFGHLSREGGGAGVGAETYVDNLTWPVSEATLYVVSAQATGLTSVQAIEGGTGRYETVIERAQTLVPSTAIVAEAEGLLRRFGAPAVTLTYATETIGLRAGQVQPVHITALGLADTMLIEEATITREAGSPTRTTVRAVSDEQGLSPEAFWGEVLGRG